uniref:WW domain-containing protein n=1 Tax=Globisporangium ultimum (strain ATCC 200006 / CBS 805.95 / DAOM BR144) TaxID=431595 RepID=K3WM54_GLOUD
MHEWTDGSLEINFMERQRRKKPTPKLHPGWNPIGKTQRRQRLAVTMIQKCFRSYLLRAAFRTNRVNVAQSFDALRAFHHVRDRKYWRTVDLRSLHREELRMLALALNLPSTGKKVLLMGRIQRWVDQRLRVHDVAGDAAAKALANRAKCQGSVYFCEAYPGAEPIDIRPLRGKSITHIAAGAESDAVYAIDGTRGTVWLCKTGGLASQIGLCRNAPIGDVDKDDPLAFVDPIESRWLVNPVFVQPLGSEHMADVRVARSHVVALAAAGELFSWGENPHGELGFVVESAAAVARNRAKVVTGLATYPAVAVAVGRHHTIAVCDDVAGHNGVIIAWGSNAYGQLAMADDSAVDMKLAGPMRLRGALETLVVLEIACGTWHSACIATDNICMSNGGRVFTWGTGTYGQLGAGMQQVVISPHYVRVPQSEVVEEEWATHIACGRHHTAVLTSANHVFMWGSVQQFSAQPQKLQLPHGTTFAEPIASLACGRTFVLFNTLERRANSYEKEQDGGHVQRLWRVHPTVIPPLDMRKLPVLPLSSSSFSKPPLRLEPAVDRALREKEERAEAARIDAIDVDALVHPLCRVCWRCDGFHPSPLKLWMCRQCCHDKQLHGVRGKNNPMSEYEAVRKLQTLYRARKAKRMLQQAREKHYERVFSIKHNAFFYYNLWRNTASWSWPERVGMDIELPIRDPDTLPVIKPPLTRYEAAVVIQTRRRGALVRRLVRTRLLQMYEKHIDVESDEVYYVHKTWTPALQQERKGVATTPALLKRLYDLGEPVEIQRLRKYANWTPDDAARVLQAHFRAHQARKRTRKQLRMRYKKLLDDATGQFFYYNTVTKVSTWEPPTTIHDKSTAATMIQALFRGYMARKRCLELVGLRYRKIRDDVTGYAYYYDTVLKQASWLKSRLLGDDLDLEIMDDPRAASPRKPSTSPQKSTVVTVRPQAVGARALVVMPRISERARVKRHKRRLQKLRQMTRDEAASRLQRVWRAHRARDQLRALLFDAYEKIYDPTTDHFYYYNKKTGVVKWEPPWLINESDVKMTRRARNVPRRRLERISEPQDAALVLQSFSRCCLARKELYALLYVRIEKVWDPHLRQYYYFDKRTGQSSWTKPLLLRYNDYLPTTT